METAQNWAMYFVGAIYGHCGRTYRGMSGIERDLGKYQVNRLVAPKTLTSTSKNPSVAKLFAMKLEERLRRRSSYFTWNVFYCQKDNERKSN